MGHRSAAPVSEQAIGRPAPRLQPFATSYVGYRMEGFAPGIHAGLPGRSITCIVSLADPVEVVADRSGSAPPRRRPGSSLG